MTGNEEDLHPDDRGVTRVLDEGFVYLVDLMGTDHAIVQAARVSTGTGSKGYEQDKKLINFLMRERHTSPFEHVELKFHVRAPIFVARQWVRHRTANWNEVSGRYKELDLKAHVPDRLRRQSKKNKQGSDEGSPIEDAEIHQRMINQIDELYYDAFALYSQLIHNGVAREQARVVLPVATYTEWYWKIDLHNLFHFLSLRCDPHAQFEIREYACRIFTLIEPLLPMACEAFCEHKLSQKACTEIARVQQEMGVL